MVEDKNICGCFHNCCSLFFLSFHQLGREEPGKLWNLPTWEDLRVPESQICGAGEAPERLDKADLSGQR